MVEPVNTPRALPASGDRSPPGAASTADRILTEAARLFATKGFAGTSTRDIATAVGIQQPGLYKHFESKDAILLAMFDAMFARTVSVGEALLRIDARAGARLFRFLSELMRPALYSPFAVASIFRTPELRLPQFAPIREMSELSNTFVRELVEQGIAEGDLREISLDAAPRIVFGILDLLASVMYPEPTELEIDELLQFALHGLARDGRRARSIWRQAAAIDLSGELAQDVIE
ncbi:MAG: TetR/AcrR family transcriptional regulator [Solirubrobacterales bacterium]